jgi:hypothetical protein
MSHRICDACGKDRAVSGGKCCEKGHFFCKPCLYGGIVLITEKALCPICKMPLHGQALTMLFHAPSLFLTAVRAYERSVNDVSQIRDNALISIVFSAASLESFVNETAASASAILKTEKYSNPRVKIFVDLQTELEESKASVKSKFIMAKWILSGTPFDKGSAEFQNFAALMELRNELVHMKATAGLSLGEALPVFREPKALTLLKDKKLVAEQSEDTVVSWTERIRTPSCALWACGTAATTVAEIISGFPTDHPLWLSIKQVYEDAFSQFPMQPNPSVH